MGSYISSMEAALPETVKLVFPNGDLREFSWSVRPSYILGKDEKTSFVCNSDTMKINGIVKAIRGDKELRLGQIYFVLLNSMLNQRLKAEEMAKLVVRASNAMRKINGGKKGRKGVTVPMTFSMVEEEEEEEKKEDETKNKIVGRIGSSRSFRSSFRSDLGSIAE